MRLDMHHCEGEKRLQGRGYSDGLLSGAEGTDEQSVCVDQGLGKGKWRGLQRGGPVYTHVSGHHHMRTNQINLRQGSHPGVYLCPALLDGRSYRTVDTAQTIAFSPVSLLSTTGYLIHYTH